MADYSLTGSAKSDISNLYEYGVDRFGLFQADDYLSGLFSHFEQIATTPRLFVKVDHIRPGYRRSVYGSHAVYFRERNGGILIVRILGRQDPVQAF